jgi:hypothetical protein
MMGVQFVGQRTKEAALLALGGSLAVWSFYLPADESLTRIWLSDRRLELTVVQWKEFGSSLSVERQGPEFQLSTEEFQEMQAAGIKGKVSVCMARAEYGRGKRSSVLILIQSAVSRPITLKEPDASNIVYFQTGGEWKKYPKDAPTLNRAIDLSPSQSDSLQTQVFVELVTGARIGLSISPKQDSVALVRKKKPLSYERTDSGKLAKRWEYRGRGHVNRLLLWPNVDYDILHPRNKYR